MRPYPAHSNDWEPPTPQPQIGDTMGTCTPSVAASEDSWPALHARVEARVTRGDAPLMSMPIDLSCAQLNVGQRSFTDSGGNVSFDLILHFPDDQALVADDRAPCTLRQASVSIDDPLDVVVHFVPVEAARDVTTAVWAIPNPSFQPSSTIGSPFDFNRPVRLGNTLAFRPGVLTGVQFVSVAILPPPRTYDLYPHSSCRMPQAANRNWNYDYCQLGLGERLSGYSGSLLPMAIKVSTGRKQTTTGSTVFLNVPSDVAFALDSGAALDAWARVPLRYTAEQEAYFRIPVSYDPRQHTAQIGLVDLQFDDARNSANDYEALIILFLTRRR